MAKYNVIGLGTAGTKFTLTKRDKWAMDGWAVWHDLALFDLDVARKVGREKQAELTDGSVKVVLQRVGAAPGEFIELDS